MGNKSQTCGIRCRTASTPASQCECSCDGANHGTQNSIGEWSVKTLDEDDPFKTIRITEDGVEVERKRKTIADTDTHSVSGIEAGDTITALLENPKEGWQEYSQLRVETVRSGVVIVKKHDGFSTEVEPDQIPAAQFTVAT